MNVELLDAFGQHYPEEVAGELEAGVVTCCAFNKWGSLLACGCNDGRLTVFDFVTRQTAKTIQAHATRILSLSWSRNGRSIATASAEHDVAVWDVMEGECKYRLHFPNQPRSVHINPANHDQVLVTVLRYPPQLLHCSTNTCVPITNDKLDEGEEEQVACFERRGSYILTGSSKGRVCVYKTDDLTLPVASFRLQSTNHITKSIQFASRVDYFMTISADRIVRVYDFQAVLLVSEGVAEPVQKLQDMVNKTPWSTCCMSGSGDFVCAASEKNVSLYIWERNTGNLVKILHGAKGDSLQDIQWHPYRPVITSVSRGLVTIWAQTHVENWSAFAPYFKELEENVEYEERESEFDVDDEDKSVTNDDALAHEEGNVDVMTVDRCSDEEDGGEQPLYFIPITPDMHHTEEEEVLSPSKVKPINVTLKSPTEKPPKARQSSPSNTRKRAGAGSRRRRD